MTNYAILDCEHVSETIDGFGEFGDMMVDAFNSIGFDPDFELFDTKRGDLPASVKDFDGYIIMGSYNGAYDTDLWIYDLGNFIQDTYNNCDRKMIGICFGHQMIGQALGGKVEKAAAGWGLGSLPLSFQQNKFPIPLPNKMNLLFSHGDQVTRLPENSINLATAEHCPHAMFSIDNRMLGLQAHPEFTSEFLTKLIHKHTPIFGVDNARNAIESLHTQPDNKTMLHILKNFLL